MPRSGQQSEPMLVVRVDLVHLYDGQGIEEGSCGLFEVDAVELPVPSPFGFIPLELHVPLYA